MGSVCSTTICQTKDIVHRNSISLKSTELPPNAYRKSLTSCSSNGQLPYNQNYYNQRSCSKGKTTFMRVSIDNSTDSNRLVAISGLTSRNIRETIIDSQANAGVWKEALVRSRAATESSLCKQKRSKSLQPVCREEREDRVQANELLYKMLPRQIADQLKSKRTVDPKSYELVSVFFSDIVSFTSLALESKPQQILTMLDDLYTLFDDVLDNYDAYKVETVGDAYMVCSGCPHKNPNHAEVLADFSLSLVDKIEKDFVVRHKPEHKLQIRIGINSGPIVAGVVGNKMPRYCLFGDTVNTASRMETNSAPNKIHLSDSTTHLLEPCGRFILESRGNISIKNRGDMVTSWLVGRKGEEHDNDIDAADTFDVDSSLFTQRRQSQAFVPTKAMRRASRLFTVNAEQTQDIGIMVKNVKDHTIIQNNTSNHLKE